MTDLDGKYFDLYKSVDDIVKSAYQDERGLSYYIDFMDKLDEDDYEKCCRVPNWKLRRKAIKHLRHIRNKISHESGVGFATQDDYNGLMAFKSELLNCTDPLTEYRKYNENDFKSNEQQNYYESHREPEKLQLGFLWLIPIAVIVVFFVMAIVSLI